MRLHCFFVVLLILSVPLALRAVNSPTTDPFAPYLSGHAPEIVREVPDAGAPPEGVNVRRVVFRSREDSEIFAVIATPKTAGQHPGMLVLHGGGGSAEVDKAIAWAQRGYVAVAPDLPGIADPKKLTETKGRWNNLKYGEGRYVASPDASASVLVDAVLSAMQSLYLLRAQPEVDTARIGVVGISWGGYMTTMVCGLAGDQVRAGFAVFGCGFYEFSSQQPTLQKMPADERERWLKYLDSGRRASGIKAAFFTAGAANDFFFWPPAVQATLDAIPGTKNHLFAPNANHKVPLPGGTVFPKASAEPFVPTPFQPFPTPSGSKANWLAMEVPYFDYYLNGVGQPLPVVTVEKSDDPLVARFRVTAPRPIVKAEIYWGPPSADWMKRVWQALPATKISEDRYEVHFPTEAAAGADWFVDASDDRPVTVSSDFMHLGSSSPANAAPAPTATPRAVIVFGDSITAGSALPKDQQAQVWVHLAELQSNGQLQLLNEGKGGRPTDSVKEFEAMLQQRPHADRLVIALGTNDSRDISEQCVPKAVAHVRAMIAAAREKYGKELAVLLVGPPNIRKDALGPTKPIADQRDAKLRELGTAFEALARELHCEFTSLYGVVPEASLTKDGVHPDVAGNEAIARALLPKLLPAAHP